MSPTLLLPLWAQIIVALLLILSGVLSLLSALGLLRFDDFFMRMHPTAILTTVGVWCPCIAVTVYISFIYETIAWYFLLLIPLMIIIVPITTVMLSRAVLFRWRNEAHVVPPSLSYTIVYSNLSPIKQKIESKKSEPLVIDTLNAKEEIKPKDISEEQL